MSEPLEEGYYESEDGEVYTEDTTAEEELEAVQPGDTLRVSDISSVKLSLSADLGSRRMLVREVLELKVGSVLALNKQAGEMADLLVCGIPLARGEVVVLGDVLHVRIAEVFGVSEGADEGYD